MQSKLHTLSGFRLTPIEIPRLRRERTGYTNLLSCQFRGCSVCRACQVSVTGEQVSYGVRAQLWFKDFKFEISDLKFQIQMEGSQIDTQHSTAVRTPHQDGLRRSLASRRELRWKRVETHLLKVTIERKGNRDPGSLH